MSKNSKQSTKGKYDPMFPWQNTIVRMACAHRLETLGAGCHEIVVIAVNISRIQVSGIPPMVGSRHGRFYE
jgi:hypothetical protein